MIRIPLVALAALVGCSPLATEPAARPPAPPAVTAAPSPRPVPHHASRSRRPEPNWAALRQCENSGSYHSKPTDLYRGAYQFDYTTWASVGGSGDPADAPASEQDRRAKLLYQARGRAPWPVCGRHL